MTPKLTHERIAQMTFGSVYPLYVNKVERKGRTEEELQQVIAWLTGFTKAQIKKHITKKSTIEAFFDDAELNPNASLNQGRDLRLPRRGDRGPPDPEGPLHGQARRRAGQGEKDGEDPAVVGRAWF